MKKLFNKKFFKSLLITILVIASVGGTCYLFYQNLTKQEDSFACVSEFLIGGDKSELHSNLITINNTLKDLGDDKLEVVIDTCDRLDNITLSLSQYLIVAKDYNVDQNKIVKYLNATEQKQSKLENDIVEFNLKSTSNDFNKILGSNDLYKSACNYINSYCDLIEVMNREIDNIIKNKSEDVKFSIYEIYYNSCRLVFTSFNSSISVEISNKLNMIFLNSKFEFDDITLLQGVDNNEFSILKNKFSDACSSVIPSTKSIFE